MALQSTVNTAYAAGVAGDMVNPGAGQNIFTPVNPIADGDVYVGSFVFPGSDPYTQASNAATVESAGADAYAISCTPASGTAIDGALTVANDGFAVSVLTSVGAIVLDSSGTASASATVTIPVGDDFEGSVTLADTAIATIADGTVTLGETLTATGDNSTIEVSAVTYDGSVITAAITATWTATTESTAVLGFVVRVLEYPNYTLTSEGTLLVPSGSGLSVAVKGAFYAASSTDATVGQAVFASATDGSICTADAGSTVSGYVDTGFTVKQGGSAGELIVIGNQ